MQQPGSLQQSNKPIWYFLLLWTLLNAIQAYTLELHGDEAYYWVYSRFLDWGYFDHPPMVAVFIKIGDTLMHNELGLRLLTVFTNSASVYLLWLVLKKYNASDKWFILVVSGLFIFHIYGFTTTPDSPLLFFTVLFYYFYQRYIDEDKWTLAFILAIVAACLLYSKYHGIILLGLTILSNLKLLTRPSFYLIVLGAMLLFIPHILWQVHHDYPSIKYHLFDRSASVYRLDFTTLYPLGQLAMAGPFVGWFLFYSAAKARVNDSFIRCLLFNFIGTFLFFFITTLKGEVQPHWTLIAFVPLLMLALIRFAQAGNPPQWFYKLALINIAFILFVRSALLFQYPFVMNIGQFKSYFGFRTWAKQLRSRIGESHLIIRDGFQDPSKYNYYTNSTRAMSYDSRYYRKNQYDIWPIEDSLQHERIYYLQDNPEKGLTTDSVVDEYNRKYYSGWVSDARTYQKAGIDIAPGNVKAKPGQLVYFNLTIHNPYAHPISFGDEGYLHKAFLDACFFQGGDIKYQTQAPADFNMINIPQKGQAKYAFPVNVPMAKGKYELFFSIRTEPFAGSRNSGMISFVVE
ncbi:glycosyltransferase family 39 protein [Mucilaginibacter sp. HMF5004]|uniref:ArnT family glycosyltransferase n=1 Tax=Mucilaginibacter rivuli TaxID=2857527 RepID=UPI001C5FE1A4|nr:glycosyltransferase family 39 protein [Mucilaginibacter rivuli]MBW4888388.1 glycosyltransferase family 39 protein [Mucilaginibacter rivuli]